MGNKNSHYKKVKNIFATYEDVCHLKKYTGHGTTRVEAFEELEKKCLKNNISLKLKDNRYYCGYVDYKLNPVFLDEEYGVWIASIYV